MVWRGLASGREELTSKLSLTKNQSQKDYGKSILGRWNSKDKGFGTKENPENHCDPSDLQVGDVSQESGEISRGQIMNDLLCHLRELRIDLDKKRSP